MDGKKIMQGPIVPLPRTTWVPADLAGVLALLRRYWLILISCGIAGSVAMLAATIAFSGPRYIISAKILVDLGPELAATPLLKARQAGAAAPMMRRPEDAATGVELFSDPHLIREVIAELGDSFFADAPPETVFQHLKHVVKATVRGVQDLLREAVVLTGLRPRTTEKDRLTLAIGAALRIEPVKRTDIISISLAFPDPRAGEEILQRFIAQALSGYLKAYRSPGVINFFRDGHTKSLAELRAAEDRLLNARLSTNDPVWSVAEQRPVLIRAEAEGQAQLRLLRTAIAATEAEVAKSEAALAKLPSEVELSTVRSRNTATDAMRSRLVQLRLDLGTQQAHYGEGSQEITDIRRQIDTLLKQIDAEAPLVVDQITVGVNQLHQTLARDLVGKQIELEGKRSSAARLEQQISGLRGQLQQIETAAIHVGHLEQDVARLRRAVDVYEKGLEEARLTEAIESVQFSGLRVIMAPTAEIVPSSPSLGRTLLLGLVGGLMLGSGTVLLREYRAYVQRAEKNKADPPILESSPESASWDGPRNAA